MPKGLIITEKPSVARDIVEALGGFRSEGDDYWESDQYLCTFALGHVLELLEPEELDKAYKRWTLDTLPIIPDEYKLKPKSGQTERIRLIKKLMKRDDVDHLINACDAGREGELIFRELVKFIGVNKPIQRLWLQSMTTNAIRTGFASLQDGRKFEGLGAAAECRSIADWLIGMNASRALTIRLRSRAQRGAWSAGRVQTPTLALLVERELEILGHTPVPYWRVQAKFQTTDHDYDGTWNDPDFKADENDPQKKSDRIFDEERAKKIVADITNQPAAATETRKPSREAAPPLFDLTSLQRTANSRFGWSAKRTLSAAQRCYETHKVLTYPRTDSRCLPNDYRGEVDKILQTFSSGGTFSASAQYLITNGRLNEKKIFNDAGVSDHFAIIPTGHVSNALKGDDQKLFDLVTRRFLGAFFPPAIWEQVERRTQVSGHLFLTKGRTLKELGWRMVLEQGESKLADGLPALQGAETTTPDGNPAVSVKLIESETQSDETKPPPRITEARLLSLMEHAGRQIEDEDLAEALKEKGLGTPATRADIIENLKAKDYVDRSLRPTVKGMRLVDLLRRIRAEGLTSAELTANLEKHLNEVEEGDRVAQEFLNEITDYTKQVVEAARTFEFDEIYPDVEPLGNCPACGKPVYERSWFYRCKEVAEGEEDCSFRIWKDKSGRYIDRETASTLLRDKKTGELDGFRDRRGRTYKAVLAIDDNEVTLKPVEGSEQQGEDDQPVFEVNPEPLGKDPIHDCPVVETPTDFISVERQKQIAAGEKKPTGFILPRLVCKREITRNEAIEYLKNGETPLIEDFISRYGRPFKAKLKIRENGRHQFEFPPREGGSKKKAAKKKTAKKKTATKKKAAAKKKSTKKKTAKKKATKKKSA